MNIVVHTRRGGKPRSIHIASGWQAGVAVFAVFVVIAALVTAGFFAGTYKAPETYVSEWQQDISIQRQQLENLRAQTQAELNAVSAKLGQMQGYVTRLDALGSRLVSMAEIETNEFSFAKPPAIGGPEDIEHISDATFDTVETAFRSLDSDLQYREAQLHVLEEALSDYNLKGEVFPQGRPIKKGWLSSYYGWRNNPFGGNKQFHKGLDFAGKEDSDILAVAGGVVTWSGRRYGYGNLVEITHGNGYVTRYGHNKANLVKEGEAVKKGQVLAKMGSTGRSTGPHVHFEVIKNGKKINPLDFISD